MIKAVSDMTHMSWNEIYEMSILDFFSYMTFVIMFNKEQENYIKNWKNNN